MLIDGHSLTYRAFFALPTDMTNSSGQVTNAVFGFTSMLINLIRDHEPDRVIVTFDLSGPTFRHEMVDSYKATRDKTPDILKEQVGIVQQLVGDLALPIVTKQGYEADDVIATLATQAAAQNDDVIIVTGDRDSYQLVEDPHIRVLYNRRGVSDYALYDEAGIEERTGVHPTKYVDYAALRGDPSDNLPGVPGVGEKTAAKLINTYGSVEELLKHIDDQTPKLAQNLRENADNARSNVEMMRLVRDVPLDVTLDDLNRGTPDAEAIVDLFNFLEFPTLLPRLKEVFPGTFELEENDAEAVERNIDHRVINAESDVADLQGELRDGVVASVAAGWTGQPGRSALTGVAICLTERDDTGADGKNADASDDGDNDQIIWWIPSELLTGSDTAGGVATAIHELFNTIGGQVTVVAHDAKAILRSFMALGLDIPGLALDTKIAAYLLDPADRSYDLDAVFEKYMGRTYTAAAVETEDQLSFEFTDSQDSTAMVEVAREAYAVSELGCVLLASLESQGLTALNEDIEVPLIHVLAKMEHLGVGVDVDVLHRLNKEFTEQAQRERAAIIEHAGFDFNVNSTKKMQEVLFEQLGLTPIKKTKTGYSTDQATLEKLQGEHPIIDHILSYREAEKLRSTYGEGLLNEVADDGRIHATFNQTVARTGRLSSDAPNLHNIPIRTEAGRKFRQAFVPAEGYELLIADYNQIELRVIAHLSEDPGLVGAFTAGEDIHTSTASRVFDVDPADVTLEQRSKAKMVSYGLAYGMEAYGLGQRLGIPTGEAQGILDAYFAAFPSVQAFMDNTVAEARERGYTETIFGRRRRIPELSSPQRNVRLAGERQAMNAPIQGLAADIFKVALVHLDAALEDRGVQSRLILQVHDEVILEVPPAERDVATEIVLDAMSGAFDLHVPLEVNLSHGMSWAAAKD